MADRKPRLSSARLSMLALIKEGILEPGERLLTFDYMVSLLVYCIATAILVIIL